MNNDSRDDTIYVIQRGKEPNTIDITNSKHTLPTIKRSLEFTFEGNNYHLQTNVIERNERIVNKQTISIVIKRVIELQFTLFR